jgi:hypothetical protein
VTAADNDLDDVLGHKRERPWEFTLAERIEIGERDDWLCGICKDPAHPVERPLAISSDNISIEVLVVEDVPPREECPDPTEPLPPHPLSASIDHIVPLVAGGTDDHSNLQLAHLFCNLHKNAFRSGVGFRRPEYVRALLANLTDSTPVPEAIHRGCFPLWAYPASRQVEFKIALYIAAREVAADRRYGNPASRSDKFIRELGKHRWQEAVADVEKRRAKWRARWLPAHEVPDE